MEKEGDKNSKPDKRPKKGMGRSISYPWIGLDVAIKRVQQFWDIEKKNEVSVTVAYGHWKYSSKSSGARMTAAALLNYGLMSTRGNKDSREIKLTELAVNIMVPQSDETKLLAIKQAALKPKIFLELLIEWGPEDLPSDQAITHNLVTKKGINPNSIETFIKSFRDTISYAKLTKSDIMPSNIDDEGGADLPIKETDLANATTTNISTLQPIQHSNVGFKQDIYTLGDEGRVILQWPEGMSEESYDEFVDWIGLQLKKIARLSNVSAKVTLKKETPSKKESTD